MHNSTNLKAEWVERIFMVLHGRFGNTFFNKYKIGQINANGEDAGLVNARSTWSHELAGISADRIKAGLESSYEHAPSCDEFKARCKAHVKHEDFKAITSKVDYDTAKVHSSEVVKFIAENLKTPDDKKDWARDIKSGKKISNFSDATKWANEALNAH